MAESLTDNNWDVENLPVTAITNFDRLALERKKEELSRVFLLQFTLLFRDIIIGASPTLLKFLEKESTASHSLGCRWHPIYGQLAKSVEEPLNHSQLQILTCAINVGILLALSGSKGMWSYFGKIDVTVWKKYGIIQISHLQGIVVNSANNPTTIKVKKLNKWLDANINLDSHLLSNCKAYNVYCGIQNAQIDCQYLQDEILDNSELQRSLNLLNAANDYISEHSPEFSNWIKCFVNFVIPVACKEGRSVSSSSFYLPSLIKISIDQSVEETSELLVHEASHQAFFIIETQDALCVKGIKRRCYSPLAQTYRPPDRVLYGYHALANIYIFFSRCIQRSPTSLVQFYNLQQSVRLQHLRAIKFELLKSKSLTDYGLSILNRIDTCVKSL